MNEQPGVQERLVSIGRSFQLVLKHVNQVITIMVPTYGESEANSCDAMVTASMSASRRSRCGCTRSWTTQVQTTMQRRKFITGLGAMVTGSAAAMGTGAFNFANVERDMTIATAGDDSAFLALESESEYTNNDGDTLAFDFETDENGSGINAGSDYSFTGIFSIENQGSQSVGVWIEDNDDGNDDVASWYAAPSDDNPTWDNSIEDSGNAYALSPGDKVYVNLVVLTRSDDNAASDLPDQINVVADASAGN